MSSVDERVALVRSTLIDHIDRVDLRVQDLAHALTFYRDVVGLEVAEQTEETATLRSPGGPVVMSLDSAGVIEPAVKDATGLFHVAIRFPTRAALGDVLARLVAAGFEIGAGDHAVSEALYVDDLDGNGVELYWDRPEEQWPAPKNEMLVPMVTLPVDLEGVLAEGRGSGAVGRPAEPGTDVGHVHLQVSDVGRTVRFYNEEVGLDLVARMGGQAGFFSSNGYHHHIGANSWSSRGGKPADASHAGLQRIVFSVADREQLVRLRYRLMEYGRHVEGDTEHTVIVRDPDGIELVFTS